MPVTEEVNRLIITGAFIIPRSLYEALLTIAIRSAENPGFTSQFR